MLLIVEGFEYGNGVLARNAHGVFQIGGQRGPLRFDMGSHGFDKLVEYGGVVVEVAVDFHGAPLFFEVAERGIGFALRAVERRGHAIGEGGRKRAFEKRECGIGSLLGARMCGGPRGGMAQNAVHGYDVAFFKGDSKSGVEAGAVERR